MLPLILLVTVFAPMLVEARRAAANERAQLARGGTLASGDVYSAMRIAYPSAFLVMLVEGAMRGLPSPAVVLTGAALFAAAKALKWWAILALGPSWTFRVITVRRSTLVTSGPYAYCRHPNYVAVIGELVGVAIMTGAWLAGPLATLGFGFLIRQRLPVEERALNANS
jgi:methyltransferase